MNYTLITILALIYFIPVLIASHRKHKNTTAIGMLNLFLGITVLGWIGAIIWATTDNTRKGDEA